MLVTVLALLAGRAYAQDFRDTVSTAEAGAFENILLRTPMSAPSYRRETLRRPDPEDPVPTPRAFNFGPVQLTPQLGLVTAYDSNIFAQENNAQGDLVTGATAQIAASLPYKANALILEGQANVGRYLEKDSQDFETHRLSARYTHRIRRNLNLVLGLSHRSDIETSGDVNQTRNRLEPVESQTLAGTLGVVLKRPTGWRIRAGLIGLQQRFDDARQLDGTQIVQRDRDRDSWGVRAELAYALSPKTDIYINSRYFKNTFRRNNFVPGSGFTGLSNDNTNIEATAGIEYRPSPLWRVDIEAGVEEIDREESAAADTTSIILLGQLEWRPRRTTRFLLGALRDADNASGIDNNVTRTAINMSFSHILTKEWSLNGSVGYGLEEFERGDREDENFSFGFGLNYALNRFAVLALRGRNTIIESSQAGSSFDRQYISLGLRLKY